MLRLFKNYLSLVKFSHTVFAMPFALIGFFLAYHELPGLFSLKLLLLVILCMVFARNAAMSFNRLVDSHIDTKNPRTSLREIPRGVISRQSASVFTIANSILFVSITWFINNLVFLLSPIALFVILFYSYTKRFTVLCHFVLGLGLALAPIGAYLAVTGKFAIIPLLYSVIVLFWVSGFDIIYALQDEDFDRSESLKSLPALLGRKRSMLVANILHVIAGSVVIIVGLEIGSTIWYWIGATLFIALLIYQHRIISPDSIKRVNMAFATTNGFASIIYAVFNVIGFLV